jgi:hypothetical protein
MRQRLPDHLQSRTLASANTCSIDTATAGSTGGRLPLEYCGVRPSHSIRWPPWLGNVSPSGRQQETARSGEYGDWVITQQAMCGSVRYRDAETTVPACHLSRLCKTCTVALCPGGTKSWRSKKLASKKSGNFLTAPRRINLYLILFPYSSSCSQIFFRPASDFITSSLWPFLRSSEQRFALTNEEDN